MTTKKWAISHVDAQAGVLVLREPGMYDATLTIFQVSPNVPGQLELATFVLKKSGSPIDLDNLELGALPCQLRWHESDGHPFGKVNINCDRALKVVQFVRARNKFHTVRNRGGKQYEKLQFDQRGSRGGYQFADSDLDDQAWFGKAGVKSHASLFLVDLTFNHENTRYHLPLQFPADPRGQWIYENHRFTLTFVLKVSEFTWSSDGPNIDCAEYEFTQDTNKDATAFRNALKKEYGNPLQSPPLHARDWRAFLSGATAISSQFIQAARDAAALINSNIPIGAHYTISAAEIICTILAEGSALQEALRKGTAPRLLRLRGYEDLGIDSFVTRYKANNNHEQDFTRDSLKQFIDHKTNIQWITNEASDAFQTFISLDLADSVHAVAMLYAAGKDALAMDLANPDIMGHWTTRLNELPLHIQHFWCTIYYNTKYPRSVLMKHGLEYHDRIWPHEDDSEKYQRWPKYNANWRTATFRFINAYI